MNRKRKPTREEALKEYPFIWTRRRNLLIPRNPSGTIYHHAIRYQVIQICGSESRPLPPTSHPRRLLRCIARALGHGSHHETAQREEAEGKERRREKKDKQEKAMAG